MSVYVLLSHWIKHNAHVLLFAVLSAIAYPTKAVGVFLLYMWGVILIHLLFLLFAVLDAIVMVAVTMWVEGPSGFFVN